jgi:hypothetical protein
LSPIIKQCQQNIQRLSEKIIIFNRCGAASPQRAALNAPCFGNRDQEKVLKSYGLIVSAVLGAILVLIFPLSKLLLVASALRTVNQEI